VSSAGRPRLRDEDPALLAQIAVLAFGTELEELVPLDDWVDWANAGGLGDMTYRRAVADCMRVASNRPVDRGAALAAQRALERAVSHNLELKPWAAQRALERVVSHNRARASQNRELGAEGADGRVRQQAAHEAFGFQVARLGGHRRPEGGLGWEVRPIWRGFEDAEESQQWRELGDAFKGLPTMVLRYIRGLLLRRGNVQVAAGESMCLHLELDAEHVKMAPLRELVGKAAAEDEDGGRAFALRRLLQVAEVRVRALLAETV
jgi:hypothetical protein